jgi:hypothetical protein
MITKTFEPVRPLRAAEDGSAYACPVFYGTAWRTHYGLSTWPSRSYRLFGEDVRDDPFASMALERR